MALQAARPLDEFQWQTQPQAQQFLRQVVEEFLSRCSGAAELSRRMRDETGTRFYDWIETIVLPETSENQQKVHAIGYEKAGDREGQFNRVWSHPLGMFPRIAMHDDKTTQIHLKVGSVIDFASIWQLREKIEGKPLMPYRRVRAFAEGDSELWAAERWGFSGFKVLKGDAKQAMEIAQTLESFMTRRRNFNDDAEGYDDAVKLIDQSPLKIDLKCALFFEAERRYWQRRNRAAQVQKGRQDRLGLGWGNHDHHTYRCSRENFARLVGLWEKLGFHCRERFYAGREAGWGAQVMEQPYAGIVTFNDVDLTPDELMGDFSHDGLAPQDALGTVGLWCGLHGDSFLQAGMHHLEAQFDFDALRQQLERENDIEVMKPFTDFPYLRQAFTEGERWDVDPKRIERLLSRGLITPEQARQFREQGAIGSHLENLERNDGFKGFNQTGVSEIISATDPRKHVSAGA